MAEELNRYKEILEREDKEFKDGDGSGGKYHCQSS